MSAQLHVADLDEADLRLFELAREPIPLAELAVRLGITIAQVDQKITFFCARFGLADRPALQAYEEPLEEPETESHEIEEVAEVEPPVAPARALSRRQALGALGAGVATVLGGAWLWQQQTPRPVAAAVGTGSSAFAAQPKLQPSLVRDDFGWEMTSFPRGIPVGWDSGAFFLSLSDGHTDAIRTDSASPPSVQGELVLSSQVTSTGTSTRAWHRSLGRGFRWSDQELSLAAVLDGALLFEELQSNWPNGGLATGRYRLVDLDLNTICLFALPTTPRAPEPIVVSPDGARGAFWSADDSSNLTLHRVDLVTGAIETERYIGPTRGTPFIPASYQRIAASDRVACVVSRPASAINASSSPASQYTLPWSGNWDTIVPVVGSPISLWAPGGVSGLRQDYLSGTTASWPVSVAQADDGRVIFSIRSAVVAYPRGPQGTPWLADGSGFIALVAPADAPETLAFSIIDAQGKSITPLPSNLGGAPAPHPTDPELIAFDNFNAWNRATNEQISAIVPGRANRQVDPWCGRPNEMVFVLPGYTGGIPVPPALLRPTIIPLVVDQSLAVRAAGGASIDLRETPLASTDIRARVPGTTPLTLSDDVDPGGLVTSFVKNNDGCWAHISTADGKVNGWTRSSAISWA